MKLTYLQQIRCKLNNLNIIRTLSTKLKVRKPRIVKDTRASPDVVDYLYATNKADILHKFPQKLLKKKHNISQGLYVADNGTAKIIAQHIVKDLPSDVPVLEVNPGLGLITKELLDRDVSSIILYECIGDFLQYLKGLDSKYPGRIKLNSGDFLNMWKLGFQDKLDNGSRLANFLNDIPKKEYQEEPNLRLIGGVASHDFMKHLINSLVFQNSLLSYGRCEMFLFMPPPLYIHLTCNSDIGYLIYRATSILFQIMFEHQFIQTLPREHFLPWQYEYNLSKNKKLTRVKSINPELLYLVKITPRRNLYELCPMEDMQALWYFVKQNCVSRKNRIIPNLEKWIPGCGPRAIVNLEPSEQIHQLFPNEDITKLPKFTKPCTTMSSRNFYPNMNIFTQFGDLSPSQMLTLFCQFRNWPEYKESPFLASLENSLLKMETASDEHVDGLEITEEDDGSLEAANELKETPKNSNK